MSASARADRGGDDCGAVDGAAVMLLDVALSVCGGALGIAIVASLLFGTEPLRATRPRRVKQPPLPVPPDPIRPMDPLPADAGPYRNAPQRVWRENGDAVVIQERYRIEVSGADLVAEAFKRIEEERKQ